MLIDCDSCVMRETAACEDCLVTHLLDASDGAVVIDLAEQRALHELSSAGLVPPSRFERVAGE